MKLLYLHHVPLTDNRANVVQVLHMCHAFHVIGIDAILAVPHAGSTSDTDAEALVRAKLGKAPGFSIRTFDRRDTHSGFSAWRASMGVKALLARHRDADLCMVRSIFMNRVALAMGFDVVYESHGASLHSTSGILDLLYRRILLKSVHCKNQIRFVAISHALAKIWKERGVPDRKILTLHDGVCAADYKDVIRQADARKALKIDTTRKLVVYAGSLYRDRGVDTIFRLAKKFQQAMFYIVGGPEQEKVRYESVVREVGLKNVVFAGQVHHQHVKDYLFAADVLLMLWSRRVPTIDICSPLKVFEYMAAERIIVGHGFPTIREVLKDGETALLVDPDSYEDLEHNMQNALRLGYPNDMATHARKQVLSQYSWEKRAKAIVRDLPAWLGRNANN